MDCTLVGNGNDAINNSSKLKWNYKQQASGFIAKFFFYGGIISIFLCEIVKNAKRIISWSHYSDWT